MSKVQKNRVPQGEWKKMTTKEQQQIIDSRKKGKNVKPKSQKVKQQGLGTRKGDMKHEREQVIASNLIPNQDSRVQISASFNTDSYIRMFYGLISYLAQKNVINVNTSEQPLQYGAIYDSLQYLMLQGITNWLGTTTSVNELPVIFDNVFQALLPKQFHYDGGNIAYGFKSFDSSTLSLVNGQNIYGHNFGMTTIVSDPGGPADPALVYALSSLPDAYTQFLSIVNKLDPKGNLATVDWKTSKTLSRDVSSFARVYSYLGNQSTAQLGGTWLDVESEVKITSPLMSKFVQYQDNQGAMDPRIPRDLKSYSLDSLSALTWPLHPSFTGYFNKTPPMTNQIDADQIFSVICLWMAKLKAKALDLGSLGAGDPLPFTQQELYLVLRNALMCVYDSQYFMQFQGNNQWTGVNQNAFLGFFVMAHCAGNSLFGRMNVPTILAENLAALKARNIGKKGARNPQAFIPVVGRWYRDTLPIFNIVAADGTVVGPLFSTRVGEPLIDLIDVTVGGNFVNCQGTYYQTVLDDWNTIVNEFKQYSAPVQEMVSDGGPPGLLCSTTTRLVTKMIDGSRVGNPSVSARVCQSLNFCENKPFDIVKIAGKHTIMGKKPPGKGVEAIPDASLLDLQTSTIVAKFPISQEAQELYDIIILPTSRTSQTNDVLLKSQVQVMGKEAYSYGQSTVGVTVAATGAGEWARVNQYANELVTGLARGETTKFQLIFDKLIRGSHAGMLAGLLGGLAKSIFPGNDAIIDTISSVVPI